MLDLVGSFGINIRRNSTCVPLTLEGLSKATICTPHRICSSMWMTCVNAMSVYGHACKRIGRIRWSQKQGSIWFPRALCEWIGPLVVKMEALLYYIQTVWGHWKTCSVEIWSQLMSMAHCNYCVCMTDFSPISVIESTTKGSCHLYSLWRLCLCTSMMIETWGKLSTKCICHCELGLPGSYGCPMIEEAEVSSYNAMSACKCTFEFSGVGVQFHAYDMVWTAGNAEWACQKGTVQDFPFGRWSLPMVWNIHNFRAVTIHSDKCTWSEVCSMSLSSRLYINISVTENTNGNFHAPLLINLRWSSQPSTSSFSL